jgi:hypothetical protein
MAPAQTILSVDGSGFTVTEADRLRLNEYTDHLTTWGTVRGHDRCIRIDPSSLSRSVIVQCKEGPVLVANIKAGDIAAGLILCSKQITDSERKKKSTK